MLKDKDQLITLEPLLKGCRAATSKKQLLFDNKTDWVFQKWAGVGLVVGFLLTGCSLSLLSKYPHYRPLITILFLLVLIVCGFSLIYFILYPYYRKKMEQKGIQVPKGLFNLWHGDWQHYQYSALYRYLQKISVGSIQK